MDNKHYLTLKEATELLSVSKSTLFTWEQKGLIEPYKTVGGQRRYDKDELLSVFKYHGRTPQPKSRVTVGYCRVAGPKQKDDLKHQAEVITNFCERNGYIVQIAEDFGTEMNDNRKGLQKIIQMVCMDQCERVVVTHKDRLTRFGIGIIEEMCKAHNAELVILNQSDQGANQKEMIRDIVSIIDESAAKLYGEKSDKHKQIVKQNKTLFTLSNDAEE